MRFAVHELRKAIADKRQIFEWLHPRSQPGAISWLVAYDKMVERLESGADGFGQAFENADLDMDVREALFKTRRGRVYRAVFIVEANNVYILRVRGPGQAPVTPADLLRS